MMMQRHAALGVAWTVAGVGWWGRRRGRVFGMSVVLMMMMIVLMMVVLMMVVMMMMVMMMGVEITVIVDH